MAKRKQPRPARKIQAVLAAAAENRPRKPKPKRGAKKKYSTHKVRSKWFQAREAWPWREAPILRLANERARVRAEVPPLPGNESWVEAGPTNIGGRMTCAVCHPTDPDRIWVGAAGGGVWHSADAGKTWTALWHAQPSLNIGSLAMDPRQPDTLYCGTGEANLSADSHPGVGVFRSLNGGVTWQLLAPSEGAVLPRRIGTIGVDPFDSNHLLLGGVGHVLDDVSGLFRSVDGGVTWALVPLIAGSWYRCHDVRFHPTQQHVIYATITAFGAKNGIWRSTDGGSTWVQLLNGLPSPDRFGRTTLALAPSDPNVIYALSSLAQSDKPLGVFRSSNRGDTWSSVGGSHFNDERQMSYNNTIVVHPQNSQIALCGGVDLHKTTNGGQTWKRVTRWDEDRGNPGYAHADHHALLMPAARPGRVYDLNDGGMDFSADAGETWANRSNGLATNMAYDLEVAQSDAAFYGGGMQDNGTVAALDGTPGGFGELTGGDGGWMVIDPNDPLHLFTSAQGMLIFRFRNGWKEVSPPEDEFNMWMVFIAMDPKRPTTVFTASRRVWRSKDDGDHWTAVSDNLDDSDVTALEVARADSNRIYVGTENGGFFRSTDGGGTWSDNLASTSLPGLTITRLESAPDDADVVYATVANFGNRHVFRSSDGGLSWTDIDGGALPDVPHHSITIPDNSPSTVYVCNDVGVFVSPDAGATWLNLTRNLPNVMVVDVVFHEGSGLLFAATYGRSIWKIQIA